MKLKMKLTMKLKIITLTLFSALTCAGPAFSQPAYLQNINIAVENPEQKVAITLNGMMPSPCFDVVPSSLIEGFMVTVSLEIRFPDGISSCVRENAPFTVTSLIETPPPGEYEVQVIINGVMHVEYPHFNIAASGEEA